MALLAGCADPPEILVKIPADHVMRQTEAASTMLHDQLQQLAAGDQRALKHPYYCVAIANRDGRLQLPDGFIDGLRAKLPSEIGAIFVPETECPTVNHIYTLPNGTAANLLIGRWKGGNGDQEYWMAGIIGPGGLSGGGDNYRVSFTDDPPVIQRETRWITF